MCARRAETRSAAKSCFPAARRARADGTRFNPSVIFAFPACACVLGALALTGCSQGPDPDLGVSASPRVATGRNVPKGGGVYKVGRPYKVAGRWYVPREVQHYDESGVASWYGSAFHGRRTANGEVFDMYALSAGHPTLPLPSYAYVTNLDNGRTILVRVNDRGPYVKDRLIDLSRRAATELGYHGRGLARVRVEYAGRAPLNGDDSAERHHLAQQDWSRSRQDPRPGPQPYGADIPTASIERRAPQESWSVTSYRRQLSQSARGAGAGRATLGGPEPVMLELGPFETRAEAARMRREIGRMLAATGPLAEEAAAEGDSAYRVRVGPLSPALARDVAERLGSPLAAATIPQ